MCVSLHVGYEPNLVALITSQVKHCFPSPLLQNFYLLHGSLRGWVMIRDITYGTKCFIHIFQHSGSPVWWLSTFQIIMWDWCFGRYFVLTASDLEELYQNPESFHHEQDMVQWTEKLRPCAEALYIVLFENHSQVGEVSTLEWLILKICKALC
jgi:hypothetical protein